MAAPEQLLLKKNRRHRTYRALLKKEKRKKRRQALAQLRDSGPSQEEIEDGFNEENQLEEEKLLETKRQKLHEEWLLREQMAQEEFRIKKEKEEAARKQKEKLERKLKAEWDKQQRKEREEEQKRQEKQERDLENGPTLQNPGPPLDVRIREKYRVYCPFYNKTGACRFGDRCSRKHNLPASSPTLLIKSMFTTFGMEQCRMDDDDDPDASLEYSVEETYQQFLELYDDVLPEFKSVGKVVQFKVSCNSEPHLRGNVYVQYQSEEECQAALSLFNGRWYAGRQLHCEFCPVTRWQMAVCDLFETQQCTRGKHCNFLHVFRNPNNEFREADRSRYLPSGRTSSPFGKNSDRKDRTGHHDNYYRRPRRRRSPSSDHFYKRDGQSGRKRRSPHSEKKSHKQVSKNRERRSSQNRGRKRDHSPSPRGRTYSRSRQTRRSSRYQGCVCVCVCVCVACVCQIVQADIPRVPKPNKSHLFRNG
ncbi:PREDICTED: U2 small nuclear ribonucleoprotein auxiliary factor 35 kDa subunit-related protein 2-like [Chrysochloris asiatica]|uniref:U2 small nuclear ribonucleoprotein auxiliary factor 35 kDa subunit-related protein 2-like n=1 Tax=Chrysochloris asiatica TaxID=185453 RepID=A0A9B0SZ17_CHRAS|nr:PREDICTED: U2 small nuclear ribonucleoprotein auxiliary factor 35 kDa subunit-related protein 2-like [Chrysochloris asiatica]